uniref:Single domain-containing protein n=1 Tax=Amblyomma maculatum TaxID=34609 RepID=G3MKG1_AMBMU
MNQPRTKSIATCMYVLLQATQITSSTSLDMPKIPFSSDTVRFQKDGTCHYGSVFFKGQNYTGDTCARLACYGSEQRLTIETCHSSQTSSGLCKRKQQSVPKTGQFPYCCDVYTCRNQGISPDQAAFLMGRILLDEATPSILVNSGGHTHPDTETDVFIGEIKTYTADSEPDVNELGETIASGHWKAKRIYIPSACTAGLCHYNDNDFKFVRHLIGSECRNMMYSEQNVYVIVEGCPILDTTQHKCAMIEHGIKADGYPSCCPVYMCPPDGYQKKAVRLENFPVQVRNGECIYKEESFQYSLMTSTKCFELTCDVRKESVTGKTCLDTMHLERFGCVAVSEQDKHRTGFPPDCCPDVVCPDMTVDNGTFALTTRKAASVTNEVCTYKDRHFRGTKSISSVCELWTCIPQSRQVEVLSCQETMEKLGEYCKWEFSRHKSTVSTLLCKEGVSLLLQH